MTTLGASPVFGQSLNGGAPGMWADTAAVDGDRPPWRRAPLGSVYLKRVTSNQQEWIQKVKDDGRNDDWVIVQGIISQFIELADFTDGGSTTGTLVLNATIPAGAVFVRYTLTNLTDFVGSAQVDFDLGDGSDADRYNPTTALRLDATAVQIDGGVPSGAIIHIAAVDALTATITDDSDFGDISSGSMTLTAFYYGGTI
jgi:hypothetical protein